MKIRFLVRVFKSNREALSGYDFTVEELIMSFSGSLALYGPAVTSQEELDTFLGNWRKFGYVSHEGTYLLYNNLLSIEKIE